METITGDELVALVPDVQASVLRKHARVNRFDIENKNRGETADGEASPPNKIAENRRVTGFRGPSPDVGRSTQFKPGQSGNPGGRPKRDIAAQIAQAIFEGNTEAIALAMLKELKKGNSKVFQTLADRAYGKPRRADAANESQVTVIIDL